MSWRLKHLEGETSEASFNDLLRSYYLWLSIDPEKYNFGFCASKINIDFGRGVVKGQLRIVENLSTFCVRRVGPARRRSSAYPHQHPHHFPHFGEWGYPRRCGHRTLASSRKGWPASERSCCLLPFRLEGGEKRAPPDPPLASQGVRAQPASLRSLRMTPTTTAAPGFGAFSPRIPVPSLSSYVITNEACSALRCGGRPGA